MWIALIVFLVTPILPKVSGGRDLPPDLAAPLRAAHFAALADDTLHRHELQLVLRTLAPLAIFPVVFKGAALAYTVYPDSACRPMGDLVQPLAGQPAQSGGSLVLVQRGLSGTSTMDDGAVPPPGGAYFYLLRR